MNRHLPSFSRWKGAVPRPCPAVGGSGGGGARRPIDWRCVTGRWRRHSVGVTATCDVTTARAPASRRAPVPPPVSGGGWRPGAVRRGWGGWFALRSGCAEGGADGRGGGADTSSLLCRLPTGPAADEPARAGWIWFSTTVHVARGSSTCRSERGSEIFVFFLKRCLLYFISGKSSSPRAAWGGHKIASFTFCRISPKPDEL